MDLIGLEPITSRLQGECSPKDELEAQNFNWLSGEVGHPSISILREKDGVLPQ